MWVFNYFGVIDRENSAEKSQLNADTIFAHQIRVSPLSTI